MRNHGVGHHSPQEETLALLALNKPSTPTLTAHASNDNFARVFSNGVTPVIIARTIVTPVLTGKFALTGTAIVLGNQDAGSFPATLALGHANAIDYTAGSGVDVGNSLHVCVSICGDDALTGQVYPLGVAVAITLNLITSAGGGTDLEVLANSAQLMVVEMSS